MRARTEPPERDCEVVVEDLDTEPRMDFLFSLKAATPLRCRRPHAHRTRHMDADPLRMERRSDLHSTRNRSLEGRRESLYYAPRAREGSIKTQRVMSYQTRGRVTQPCFSNCTIRGTGPSARPRRNAATSQAISNPLSHSAQTALMTSSFSSSLPTQPPPPVWNSGKMSHGKIRCLGDIRTLLMHFNVSCCTLCWDTEF